MTTDLLLQCSGANNCPNYILDTLLGLLREVVLISIWLVNKPVCYLMTSIHTKRNKHQALYNVWAPWNINNSIYVAFRARAFPIFALYIKVAINKWHFSDNIIKKIEIVTLPAKCYPNRHYDLCPVDSCVNLLSALDSRIGVMSMRTSPHLRALLINNNPCGQQFS